MEENGSLMGVFSGALPGNDLDYLRASKWIDYSATRVVIVSFTTYNFDYDLWTASAPWQTRPHDQVWSVA